MYIYYVKINGRLLPKLPSTLSREQRRGGKCIASNLTPSLGMRLTGSKAAATSGASFPGSCTGAEKNRATRSVWRLLGIARDY